MASRVDLNGLLVSLKSIFDGANTTTATPIDLSSGLANSVRVKTVMTVNPNLVRPEANLFPLVTSYISKKSMKDTSMGVSQANIKRRGMVYIDVVGAIWNDTFTAVTSDPADKDIHYLMENIELILRSNETIAGGVIWQVANDVTYYDIPFSEEVHLRSGILSLKADVFY